MKKIILISLITTLCLITFISCNSDAINGIYRDIAESQPNTDVTMISYLGHTSEPDTYYYLADDGVYSYSNGVTKAIRTSDSEKSVRGAYLDVSGKKLYVSLTPKGTSGKTEIQYCDLGNDQQDFKTFDKINDPINGLLSNGFCWTSNKIYRLSEQLGEAETIQEKYEITEALGSESTSDQYAYFLAKEKVDNKYTGNNRIYVYKAGTEGKPTKVIDVETKDSTYCGFQYIGKDESDKEKFLLFSQNGNTDLITDKDDSDSKEDSILLGVSLPNSTNNASFYDESSKKAIIMCANSFIEISTESAIKKEQTKTNGYAQDISNAEITNIIKQDDGYIAGTTNGLLYKISVSDDKNELINGNITK